LRIALATVTKSPIAGESTKEAVKTNRAGNAGMFGEPVVTYLRAFLILHARLRVWPVRPAFPAPSILLGE
jgi:hypothetical protein